MREFRIQSREGQKIRTKRLTEEEVRIEKVQIKCPVPGCNFKTEYLGTLLAKEQNDVHWRTQHEAKFEQEELDRKVELEEQEKRAREQKLDIVLFDTDERKEFEDLKEEDSGVESDQMNSKVGMFSEKLEKVVMANDDKIVRTLEDMEEKLDKIEKGEDQDITENTKEMIEILVLAKKGEKIDKRLIEKMTELAIRGQKLGVYDKKIEIRKEEGRRIKDMDRSKEEEEEI